MSLLLLSSVHVVSLSETGRECECVSAHLPTSCLLLRGCIKTRCSTWGGKVIGAAKDTRFIIEKR